MEDYQNTAVLFFSRSADAEVLHKKFTANASKHTDIQIAEQLISHTYRQITETGLPFFVFDEQRQTGDTFGERFASAFSEVFNKGFQYVIAVGHDIPTLTANHITKAAQKLRSGSADIVLGPDVDGGIWLTGFSRQAFDNKQFRDLPWQTAHLLESMLSHYREESQITLLETQADIDNPAALEEFAKGSYACLALLRLVQHLQAILSTPILFLSHTQKKIAEELLISDNPRRAPPF